MQSKLVRELERNLENVKDKIIFKKYKNYKMNIE